MKIQEDSAIKVSLSTMFTSLMKDGMPIPANMQPIFNVWIENTMIPMVAQNEEQKAVLTQQMQQAQMQPQGQQDGQVPQETLQEQPQSEMVA